MFPFNFNTYKMKNIYKNTRNLLLCAALLATVVSCKKSFLEIVPKGRIIASKTTDYTLMLNNLDLINSVADNHAFLGDEIAAVEPTWASAPNRDKQLFKYEGDIYTQDEDADETLAPLRAMYIYNKIINEVMQSTGGTETEKKSVRGEAMAGRAWTYFFLVNYFGKPYNPATAATDLAFPLITKAEVTETKFERATVQQIYDLIISDLNTAISDVSNTGVSFRTRLSKATAKGILAKVYQSMGRHADALTLLNQSIAEIPGQGAAVVVALYNYNTALPGFPTTVNDTENIYSKSITNALVFSTNRLLYLTPEAAALFDPADLRLAPAFYAVQATPVTAAIPTGRLIRRTGTTVTHFGLRLADLYLMRAEEKARMDDLPGAVADVEFLRKNRLPNAVGATPAKWPVPAAIASSKLPLIQFILQERIREFAAQGYRWYDMRRLSVDPLFSTPAYTHKVYNTVTGFVTESFTLKPERWVFKFSPKIMGENPGLVNNP
jgi:tetratricopeptide (TPR) repeat protein